MKVYVLTFLEKPYGSIFQDECEEWVEGVFSTYEFAQEAGQAFLEDKTDYKIDRDYFILGCDIRGL